MRGSAPVVSLSARRSALQGTVPRAHEVADRDSPTTRGRVALAAGLGLALVLGIPLLAHHQEIGSVMEMSVPLRGGLYQRTLDDVQKSCTIPEASSGPLRDHCLAQAQFLRLLPECSGECQRVTEAFLPHAHR